jgi:branched-chain amino acid transport system ATP-binding protein
MSRLLEVHDLTGGYGPVQVLHGLDLHVDEGEVVVILGANGSGKTTTLRALSGMLAARGRAELGGVSLLGRRPEDVVRLGVAHVPQGRGTVADLTVQENLRIGAYTRRDHEVTADLERSYEMFPRLAERRDQSAGNLSGGEQQMLAIARALMSRPRLLLLDEPSLGLAPILTRALFDQLGGISRTMGTTMLIVEQNANLALAIADRGYVLEAGLIAVSGTADDLADDTSVRRAYLGY